MVDTTTSVEARSYEVLESVDRGLVRFAAFATVVTFAFWVFLPFTVILGEKSWWWLIVGTLIVVVVLPFAFVVLQYYEAFETEPGPRLVVKALAVIRNLAALLALWGLFLAVVRAENPTWESAWQFLYWIILGGVKE